LRSILFISRGEKGLLLRIMGRRLTYLSRCCQNFGREWGIKKFPLRGVGILLSGGRIFHLNAIFYRLCLSGRFTGKKAAVPP